METRPWTSIQEKGEGETEGKAAVFPHCVLNDRALLPKPQPTSHIHPPTALQHSTLVTGDLEVGLSVGYTHDHSLRWSSQPCPNSFV